VPRILLIDDDPVFAELTARRLATGGHQVDVRHEATGAVADVRPETYALVLVDVVMPGISGTLLLDVLGSRTNRPALVLLSSIDIPQLAALAEQHGADGWISKSATRVELLERVDVFLKRSRSSMRAARLSSEKEDPE
jgi:DNA-binding response OmpR family regulator